MNTEEKISVMRCSLDPKNIIQFRTLGPGSAWMDLVDNGKEPSWNFEKYEYRIKPRAAFRAFTSADECIAEMRKHKDWIASRDGHYFTIICIYQDEVRIGSLWINFTELAGNYVWADDGSPCGIMEVR